MMEFSKEFLRKLFIIMSAEKSSTGFIRRVSVAEEMHGLKLPHVVFLVTNREEKYSQGKNIHRE